MGGCLSLIQQAIPQVMNLLGGDFGSDAGSFGKNDDNNQNQNHQNGADMFGPNSPMYPSLPAGAQQVTVRNVYDGDTLTLTDERRVRLLGVDTPEVKENQPFAQEAKDYTKTAILGDGNQRNGQKGNDVWISFEPGQESEDKYGRLLAYVWVRSSGEDNEKENGNGNGGGFANAFNRFGDGDDDDEEQQMNSGYLCVNEGIIAAGYASAYTPNANSKTRNWDKLVSLQMQARESKRGMWSADTGTTAASNSTKYYKTANGSAYHHKNCEHLSNIRNLTELTASEALSQGLHPCRTCVQ